MSKYVQTEPFRNQHDVQSMIRCTNKERIKWCRKHRATQKTYQKHSQQSSVHHEQQVELRKKVASGSTIADEEAA